MQYSGLNASQVEAARSRGVNRLDGKKKNSIAGMFFSQFKDLMILILACATVVSALMGDTVEAVAIIAIVLLNAVMGFLQEYKTEKTLTALQSMTAPAANVIRDRQRIKIPAEEIVCGDIVLLQAGDRIPADGELLEADAFSADEALLTGESAAVDKKPGDKIYMGTMVTAGTAVLCVQQVGMSTEMGRIASLIDEAAPEKTPLQLRLQQLGKTVAISCLVVCISVGLLGCLRGEPFLEMLLSGISLAVAAIPEGMPAIVTVVLALSVGRILKKGAIIRRLPAVETLGCAGVICSDKTGTITQNRMTLFAVCIGNALWQMRRDRSETECALYRDNKKAALDAEPVLVRLLRCAVLCSDVQTRVEKGKRLVQGSATETALVLAAYGLGVPVEQLLLKYRRHGYHPFDSTRKRMSVTVQSQGGKMLYLCKGAPDILLRLCSQIALPEGSRPMTAADRQEINSRLLQLAAQGCRIIAFAENENAGAGENGMVFLGLTALEDPPKPQVESAVRRCRRAGMKPVMITGDHPETARAIAQRVGIFKPGDRIATGAELEQWTDEQLASVCMQTSVFARVTPQHKLRIVRAYQSRQQVVAMTGDAVIFKTDTGEKHIEKCVRFRMGNGRILCK